MNKTAHKIFIGILVLIVLSALILLINYGYSYYRVSLEERYFHPANEALKPSGILGHGFGIIGSLLMILGVSLYMLRKRFRVFHRIGILKHWLEFHIFLCTLGPILVLFHTSFKFGGIVAISFWSMVAVFLSGVIGRFIYLQIPRTIEGRELSLSEVQELKGELSQNLIESLQIDASGKKIIEESISAKAQVLGGGLLSGYIRKMGEDRKSLGIVRNVLKKNNVPKEQQKQVIDLVKSELSLNRRIERLSTMQNLFKYWHVAHLPFALVMLIIMIIHVGVTIVFGYKWIF